MNGDDTYSHWRRMLANIGQRRGGGFSRETRRTFPRVGYRSQQGAVRYLVAGHSHRVGTSSKNRTRAPGARALTHNHEGDIDEDDEMGREEAEDPLTSRIRVFPGSVFGKHGDVSRDISRATFVTDIRYWLEEHV